MLQRVTKYAIYSALSASLLLGGTPHAHATSLKEALASTYRTNPGIKASRSALESAAELYPQAYATWLPQVSASYAHGQEKQEFGGAEEDNTITTQRIQVAQPIFDGFSSLAQLDQAEYSYLATRYALKVTEQDTLSQAVDAYISVVRAQEVFELNTKNVSVLTEQLSATVDRFELGETTRTDVAQAESRPSSAIAEKTTAHGDLVSAQARYRQTVGIDPHDLSMPKSLPAIPSNLTEAIKRSLEHNPSVKQSEFNKLSSEESISLRKAALLPSASIDALKQKEEGLASFFSGDEREVESITLNVTIPLYQSGAEYSRVRQAKRNAEEAGNDLDRVKDVAVQLATESWQSVRTTRAAINSTADAVKAAEIALDGVKQEAEVGARTVLDILDAEQELFRTKVQLVTARSNEVIATYNLLSSIGSLTAKDLNLPVKIINDDEYLDKVKYRMVGF